MILLDAPLMTAMAAVIGSLAALVWSCRRRP